jgi:ribosomal protein L7/L12
MALTINIKPQEISNFVCTVEITIPADDVIEIVSSHEVPGVEVAGFNKIDAIKEVRAKYGTCLRDSKQIVEAVMVQLGFPRHLG